MIENANATYSEIVTKAKSIIKEQESTFKEMLEISYIEDFITLEKRAGNLPINELDPIKSIMDAIKSDPKLFPKFADSLNKMKTYKIEGIGPYK